MLFTSVEFLAVFVPIVFFLYYRLGRRDFRIGLWFLIFSSFVFYGRWNSRDLALVLCSILTNYSLALALTKVRRRQKAILILGIILNLSALTYFKYSKFVVSSLHLNWDWAQKIALPLAISFFTFQQIAYLVHTYRKLKTQNSKGSLPHFRDYCLFIAFFPHLIAGPIVKDSDFLHQISASVVIPNHRKLLSGFVLFFIGFAKKTVIADSLAPIADQIFALADKGAPLQFWQSLSGVLAYSLQIYFDFSGYSDMALGLARCLNFELPQNFNSPYRANSISDFWKRWHMTLSLFLRDYLYIPLGGNRHGPWRRNLNLMITMLLGGLWHGASWTFVAWGGLHGVYLIIAHLWRWPLPSLVSRPLTLLTVFFAWIFFRASNFDSAVHIIGGFSNSITSLRLVPLTDALQICGALLVSLLPFNSDRISAWVCDTIQRKKLFTLGNLPLQLLTTPRLVIYCTSALVLLCTSVASYYSSYLDYYLYNNGWVQSARKTNGIDNSSGTYRQNFLNSSFFRNRDTKKIAVIGSSFTQSFPDTYFEVGGKKFSLHSLGIGGNSFDNALRGVGMAAQFHPHTIVLAMSPLHLESFSQREALHAVFPTECIDAYTAVLPHISIRSKEFERCLEKSTLDYLDLGRSFANLDMLSQFRAFAKDTLWLPPRIFPLSSESWRSLNLAELNPSRIPELSVQLRSHLRVAQPAQEVDNPKNLASWWTAHPLHLLDRGKDIHTTFQLLANFLMKKGIHLILYSSPTTRASQIYPPQYLAAYRQKMRALARDLRISYLDLTDYLPWDGRFFTDAVHPTSGYPDSGRDILAQRIALHVAEDILGQRYILDEAGSNGFAGN